MIDRQGCQDKVKSGERIHGIFVSLGLKVSNTSFQYEEIQRYVWLGYRKEKSMSNVFLDSEKKMDFVHDV